VAHVRERPADVGGGEIELLLGLRAEATDGQIAVEDEDRPARGDLDVEQIAVQATELCVPVAHLVVDGDEFCVRGDSNSSFEVSNSSLIPHRAR
jgi:hypothetical protein